MIAMPLALSTIVLSTAASQPLGSGGTLKVAPRAAVVAGPIG